MLSTNDKCLLTELADGTGVVLHLDTKFYYTLNVTGVVIWKAIAAGSGSEPEIVARLVQEFDVASEAALADVTALLEMMVAEGLIHSSVR